MGASTYVVPSGSVALSASATKSLWLINPATPGFRLTEVAVSFDASTASVAPRVELYRITTIGPATGTNTPPIRVNAPLEIASQSTAQTVITSEPTAVEVLRQWFIQPGGGLVVLQYPLGREPAAAGGGQRIGLRVITPAAVTPNVCSYGEFEE